MPTFPHSAKSRNFTPDGVHSNSHSFTPWHSQPLYLIHKAHAFGGDQGGASLSPEWSPFFHVSIFVHFAYFFWSTALPINNFLNFILRNNIYAEMCPNLVNSAKDFSQMNEPSEGPTVSQGDQTWLLEAWVNMPFPSIYRKGIMASFMQHLVWISAWRPSWWLSLWGIHNTQHYHLSIMVVKGVCFL